MKILENTELKTGFLVEYKVSVVWYKYGKLFCHVQGPTGATGPSGAPGAAGQKGDSGPPGQNGRNGNAGIPVSFHLGVISNTSRSIGVYYMASSASGQDESNPAL